jgi:hypothetical protein
MRPAKEDRAMSVLSSEDCAGVRIAQSTPPSTQQGVLMADRTSFRAFLCAATLLLMTGCHPAMSTQSDSSHAQTSDSSMFPLRFVKHDFQVFCYNTIRCHVIYNDFNFKAEERPSPPPPSADYRDHWPFASYLGIRNFPPPAEVNWTSLDGVAHTAKVDIGAIFKDERVLYSVPDAEIPDRSWGGEPGILLEVNDRTINVYMKAFICHQD